jgi:hypothetical protein
MNSEVVVAAVAAMDTIDVTAIAATMDEITTETTVPLVTLVKIDMAVQLVMIVEVVATQEVIVMIVVVVAVVVVHTKLPQQLHQLEMHTRAVVVTTSVVTNVTLANSWYADTVRYQRCLKADQSEFLGLLSAWTESGTKWRASTYSLQLQ